MKKILFSFVNAMLLCCMLYGSAQAQTTVAIGIQAGSSFGNLFLGPTLGLQSTFAKHYEFDLSDTFSPLESHIALGNGWANHLEGSGIGWITKGFGIDGGVSYSNYKTSIYKSAEYGHGGVVLQHNYQGTDVRYTLNYIREFHNGISADGAESDHLQGGDFGLQVRTGCSKHFCYRTDFDFQVGHVLTQGNPVCDGTYGLIGGPNGGPCPRTGAWAGAFTGAFMIEFGGK